MGSDPEKEIEAMVARENPRRIGESDRAWQKRLSSIRSRAIKRFWNDLYEIQAESGADLEKARELYRDALEELGRERGEVTRDEIVHVVAEAMEEEAAEHPESVEESIWTGETYVWEFQNEYEAIINSKLSAGFHDYEATLWVYKGARLLGNGDVVFGASPSEWFYNFHEAARDFLRETLGSESPKGITFFVTEVRIVA